MKSKAFACGGTWLNDVGSPPAVESEKLNSGFLFFVHFLPGFSALDCSFSTVCLPY